jgi:hypothetical protein
MVVRYHPFREGDQIKFKEGRETSRGKRGLPNTIIEVTTIYGADSIGGKLISGHFGKQGELAYTVGDTFLLWASAFEYANKEKFTIWW